MGQPNTSGDRVEDLNSRPLDYKSSALTTKPGCHRLHQLTGMRILVRRFSRHSCNQQQSINFKSGY